MTHTPSGKSQLNVYIGDETRALLEEIKNREAIPYGRQLDLAMKKWAAEVKGVTLPSRKGGKRAAA